MRLRARAILTLALVFAVPASSGFGAVKPGDLAISKAEVSADAWLPLVDQARYDESWDAASKTFKSALAREKWMEQVKEMRAPLGALVSRKLSSAKYLEKIPGAPAGKYVVIQYETSFEKKNAMETVTPMLDPDGSWRVSGYYVK
jgi:hypothetical protein